MSEEIMASLDGRVSRLAQVLQTTVEDFAPVHLKGAIYVKVFAGSTRYTISLRVEGNQQPVQKYGTKDALAQEYGSGPRSVTKPTANEIDIYDTMSVAARYRSGAMLTYSLTAYAPWEGYTLVFNGTQGRLEVLFIERARHAGDPWSGDLGFPGGKVETHDADPRFAAERETLEEIGFDLHKTRFLGCLTEITGASMPVRVTCFVYGTSGGAELHLNDEVQDAFWVPLADLLDPERRADVPVHSRGETLPRPAIRLAQPEKPVLWGLTYRLVSEFLTLMS